MSTKEAILVSLQTKLLHLHSFPVLPPCLWYLLLSFFTFPICPICLVDSLLLNDFRSPHSETKKKNSFQTDHPPLDLLTNLPKGCDLMAVSKVTSSYLSYKSYIALLGLQVVWLTFPLRSALMPSLTWTFPLTLPLYSLQHCHLFLLTVLPGSVTSDPRGKHVPRLYSPTYHLLPTHLCHHYTDIKITFPSLCPGARLQISSDS